MSSGKFCMGFGRGCEYMQQPLPKQNNSLEKSSPLWNHTLSTPTIDSPLHTLVCTKNREVKDLVTER